MGRYVTASRPPTNDAKMATFPHLSIRRWIMAEQTFVRESYLADRWGVKDRTLQRWRQKRCGPPYHKIEGRVLYVLEECIVWEDQQRRVPHRRQG
jgi:hypothetical protein